MFVSRNLLMLVMALGLVVVVASGEQGEQELEQKVQSDQQRGLVRGKVCLPPNKPCKRTNRRVCGTNKRTYSDLCDLRRDACRKPGLRPKPCLRQIPTKPAYQRGLQCPKVASENQQQQNEQRPQPKWARGPRQERGRDHGIPRYSEGDEEKQDEQEQQD